MSSRTQDWRGNIGNISPRQNNTKCTHVSVWAMFLVVAATPQYNYTIMFFGFDDVMKKMCSRYTSLFPNSNQPRPTVFCAHISFAAESTDVIIIIVILLAG